VNCQQFEIFLDQYLDGDLDGTLKLEFEAHLVKCKACGHLYAMMDAAGQIIADDDPNVPVLSAGFTDRVMAGIGQQKQKTIRIRRWLAGSTAAAAVAMIVLGLAAIYSFGTGESSFSQAGSKNDPLATRLEQRLLAMNDSGANRREIGTLISSDEGLAPQIKASVLHRDLPRADQQDISLWLASKLDCVGSNLKEINDLRTRALDQMKQGFIKSLSSPMMPVESYLKSGSILPMPSMMESAEEQVAPSPVEQVELEAGVELL
jgi:hypothetical protein